MQLIRFLSICSFALLCSCPFARSDVRADYYNATLVSGTWSCAGKSMTTRCDASAKGDSPLCIDRGTVIYCCSPNEPFCKSASVQCNLSAGASVLCGGECCREKSEICAGSNTFSNTAADQCASLTTFNPLNDGSANSYSLALTQYPHPGEPATDMDSTPSSTSGSATEGSPRVSSGGSSNIRPTETGSSLSGTSGTQSGISNSRTSVSGNSFASALTGSPSSVLSGFATSATKTGSKGSGSTTAAITTSETGAPSGSPGAPNVPGSKQPESEEASSNLYGLGVRMGFYMLGAASVIGFFHAPCIDSAVQVLAAVISFAYLTAWTKSVTNYAVSPSEASVVLAIISACLLPAMLLAFVWAGLPWARHQLARIVGPVSYRENVEERAAQQESLRSLSSRQAVVLLLLGISSFWLAISAFWLWGTKVYQLPTNGHNNIGWFFATIGSSDTGTFRALMLFLCVLLLLICLVSALCFLRLWKAAAGSWTNSITEKREDTPLFNPTESRKQHSTTSMWPAMLIAVTIWAFCIAFVESTIQVNHLSPSTTADSTAQLLVLVAGVLALLSALLLLLRSLVSDLSTSSSTRRSGRRKLDYLKEKLKEFMSDPLSYLPGITSRNTSREEVAASAMATEPHLSPWDPASTFARGTPGRTKYERIRTPPKSPMRGYIHSDNSREPSPLPTLEENP